MRRRILISGICIIAVFVPFSRSSSKIQATRCDISGIWQSEGNSRKIEIYRSDGKWFGKLISSADKDAKPGFVMLRELVYDEKKNKYKGKMVRPGSDKEISAEITCAGDDAINLTGRMGLMSRSHKWYRSP
jgi:uncharacterized protein (DUF2147 family)